ESAPEYYERKYHPEQYNERQALHLFLQMPENVQSAVTKFMLAMADFLNDTGSLEYAQGLGTQANELAKKADRETQRLFNELADRTKQCYTPEVYLSLAKGMQNIMDPQPVRHEAEQGAERPSLRSRLSSLIASLSR